MSPSLPEFCPEGSARERRGGLPMFLGAIAPDIPMSPRRFPVGQWPSGKQVSSPWREMHPKTWAGRRAAPGHSLPDRIPARMGSISVAQKVLWQE